MVTIPKARLVPDPNDDRIHEAPLVGYDRDTGQVDSVTCSRCGADTEDYRVEFVPAHARPCGGGR